MSGLVMIFMPDPQPAMHQILVGQPGDKLHDDKSNDCDQYIKYNFHNKKVDDEVVAAATTLSY